jgi:hypothetical protein
VKGGPGAPPEAAAPGGAPEPRRWPRRVIILRVAFLVLALVGLYVVWPSLMDVSSSWPRLRIIAPGWYAAMAAAETVRPPPRPYRRSGRPDQSQGVGAPRWGITVA